MRFLSIAMVLAACGGHPAPATVPRAPAVAPASDLAAAKTGETERALALYRKIVDEFPTSRYAAVSLFDIAAIYDGRADLVQTIGTLRELVAKYPDARESVDGHLFIAALQADHEQFADAVK